MKLRFRLPDEDEDEPEVPDVPDETGEGPEPEGLTLQALTLAGAAASAQVFWPLPLLYVVIFGALGVGIGLAGIFRFGKAGVLAGIVAFALADLFTPASAPVSFVLRTICVMLAALGLTLGVGALIERSRDRSE